MYYLKRMNWKGQNNFASLQSILCCRITFVYLLLRHWLRLNQGLVLKYFADQIKTLLVLEEGNVAGARSEKYVGCGKTATFVYFKNCFTISDVLQGHYHAIDKHIEFLSLDVVADFLAFTVPHHSNISQWHIGFWHRNLYGCTVTWEEYSTEGLL